MVRPSWPTCQPTELAAWDMPTVPPQAVPLGTLRTHACPISRDTRSEAATTVQLPTLLSFPHDASLLLKASGEGTRRGGPRPAKRDPATALGLSARQIATDDLRSPRPGSELLRLYAPGRLRRTAGRQSHLDGSAAHQSTSDGPDGTHGERDPEVSTERVPIDPGVQRAGGRSCRAVPCLGDCQLSLISSPTRRRGGWPVSRPAVPAAASIR